MKTTYKKSRDAPEHHTRGLQKVGDVIKAIYPQLDRKNLNEKDGI